MKAEIICNKCTVSVIAFFILFLFCSFGFASFMVSVNNTSQLSIVTKYGTPTAVCLTSITSSASKVQRFVQTSHKELPSSLIGISWETISSFTVIPSALGAVNGIDLIEEYALITARLLHDIGIDFIYGIPITGDSKYSLASSSFKSALLVSIFIRAFRAYGMLSVIKGFPISLDEPPLSHLTISKSAFENSILVAFRALKTRTHIDAIDLEPVYLDFLDSKNPVVSSETVKKYVYHEIEEDTIFVMNGKGLSDKQCEELSEKGLVNIEYSRYISIHSRVKKGGEEFKVLSGAVSYGKKIFGNVRDDIKELNEMVKKINIASITLVKQGYVVSRPEHIYICDIKHPPSIKDYNVKSVRYDELSTINLGNKDVLIFFVRSKDEFERITAFMGKKNVILVTLYPLTIEHLDEVNSVILVYDVSHSVIDKIVQITKGEFHPSGTKP